MPQTDCGIERQLWQNNNSKRSIEACTILRMMNQKAFIVCRKA